MGYRPICFFFWVFLIKNLRIRPTNEVNSNTVCGREIRYFSHTYQSRFTMLLLCNTALNRRISLEPKSFWKTPIGNIFWRDVTQWVSIVWVNSIYSVIKLNEDRKGFLVSGWGHLCMGIFKKLNVSPTLHCTAYYCYCTQIVGLKFLNYAMLKYWLYPFWLSSLKNLILSDWFEWYV